MPAGGGISPEWHDQPLVKPDGWGFSDPFAVDPLVVEVEQHAGGKVVVPWAGQELTIQTPINGLPSASLPVNLHEGWGVNTGSAETPDVKPLDEALYDDQVITVRTARESPEQDVYLFQGLLDKRHYHADERGKRATLQLTHLADVLRREEDVQGQLWLNKAALETLEEDPGAFVAPTQVTALDCIFNPATARNCRRTLVRLPITGTSADICLLPVFTHGKDDDAMAWTWARVFLYLLALPRLTPGVAAAGDFTRYKFVELPDVDGDTLTERIINNGWQDLDPYVEAPDMGYAWSRALASKPNSHSIEGLAGKWIDALSWCCARCGIGYAWEPARDELGAVVQGLRFFTYDQPEPDPRRVVMLPSPAFATHDKSWQAVRQQANVMNLDIEEDIGAVVNAVEPRGATSMGEITIELVPGWRPNEAWDVDPDDQGAVDELIEWSQGGSWHNAFDTAGRMFGDLDHWLVGRLWGVNTWGAWSGHARAFGPFDEAAYEVLDLADVRLGEQGASTVRPRTLEQCISGYQRGLLLPPKVEISYNSGADWKMLTGEVAIGQTDLRVYLQQQDLQDIVAPDDGGGPTAPEQNYVEQYIRGRVRLRVTAGLKIDQAFGGATLLSDLSLSQRTRKAVLQRRSDWMVARRNDHEGVEWGNSQYNEGLPQHESIPHKRERDDSLLAMAEAERYLRTADRVRQRGPVVLPGLVFAYKNEGGELVSGYRPGDIIEGCLAEPEADRWHDLQFLANQQAGGAVLASIDWRYKVGPGERFTASTHLQLEDVSRQVSFGGVR